MFHKFANLESNTVSRELPKGLNSLGFALCLWQPSSLRISSVAFKCKPLRNSLIHRVSPNKQSMSQAGDELIAEEDSCI